MSTIIPTLTTVGWVRDDASVAMKALEYFITSEPSQSQLYRGQIVSLPNLVKEYGGEPNTLASRARNELRNMLLNYFSSVDVDSVSNNLDSESGRYNLEMDVTFTGADGKNQSLGYIMQISNSKIFNVSSK